jgi:hypothetical protein
MEIAHAIPTLPQPRRRRDYSFNPYAYGVRILRARSGKAFPLTSLAPFGTLPGYIRDRFRLVIAPLNTKSAPPPHHVVLYRYPATRRSSPHKPNGWRSDGHGTHDERCKISLNLSMEDSDLQCNC